MNFAFTDEQEELRRTIRRFCEERSPSAEVRRLMETPEGYDEVVWKQMGEELALQGIHVPEAYDGLVVLRKVAPTPEGFPRRVGVAKKRPLA